MDCSQPLALQRPISFKWNVGPNSALYFSSKWYSILLVTSIDNHSQISPIIIWTCTLFEALLYLSTPKASPSPFISFPLCLSSQPHIHTTPLLITGVLISSLGTYIRLDCFRTLGEHFTFDLTILPKHKLITHRLYGYVRHPSYTGGMFLVAGLTLSHLTKGSWLTECSPLGASGTIVVWATWWTWSLAVARSRAEAEDKALRKTFNEEWDRYAVTVPYWFFPGLIWRCWILRVGFWQLNL